MKTLVTLTDTPFMAGVETAVLSEVPEFSEPGISEVVMYDPWWGTVVLVVRDYVAGTYPTFNTFGEIMFDADRSHFRCGTPLWWGIIIGYILPIGS